MSYLGVSRPIRIAHVVPSFAAGGIERMLEHSVLPMREQGIEYGVFVHSDNIPMAGFLREQNVPIVVEAERWRSLRYFSKDHPEVSRIAQRIKKEIDPDVISVHHGWSYHIAYVLAREMGLPLVITKHCVEERWQTDNSFVGRVTRYQVRLAHKSAAAVICVGAAVRLDLEAMNWKIPNLQTIEILTSETVWETFNATGPRPYDVVLLGRLVPQKNVVFAIECLGALHKKRPDLKIAVVGDGPLRASLEDLAEKLGLTPAITFFGMVSSDKALEITNQSKVFYAPSLAEGLSQAAVEALGLGLNAVVSDIAPFTLTFPNEEGIEFVSTTDQAGNVTALERQIDAFGPFQRPHLRRRFSLARYVEETAAMYRKVVAGAEGAGKRSA